MLRHLGYRSDLALPGPPHFAESRLQGEQIDALRQTIRENLRELARILHFNAERGIRFYRVSSRIIPWAANPERTLPWWDEFAGELGKIGQFCRRSELRLEMHPGLLSMLNSPSLETVALSILELGWHVRFLHALQLDTSHKLILRVGCTFGDRSKSLDRFVAVVNQMPADWNARLAIENNDAHYCLGEVLDVSTQTGLPVVFAYAGRSGTESGERDELARQVDQAFQTWKLKDGVPIVHLGRSSGNRPKSARNPEWVDPHDLESLLMLAPNALPFDCLLESAQGDRAVFDLLERPAIRETLALPSSTDRSVEP